MLNRKRKNPCVRNGVRMVTAYIIWLKTAKKKTCYTQEVVLHQLGFNYLKTIAIESWNTAVVDSGATNKVARASCFICYMSSLSENEKQKVQCYPVNNTYRFRDAKFFPALPNVDKPIILGNKSLMVNTDVVTSDIPLLLSKKLDMTLDFKNDNALVFDESIQLIVTKSGHYARPITRYKTILNNVVIGVNKNVTVLATDTNKSKYDIALKLHRQFASPSPDRLTL